jgi:UDP-N-acetyl-D-mannosaminuronic acid dehydrogenase
MADGRRLAGEGDVEVVVIGCGAIGLPLAAAIASIGRRTLGIDIDRERAANLSEGRSGLTEPGLDEALEACLTNGRLAFADALEPAEHARAFVIAVPTPVTADGGMDEAPLKRALATVTVCARPRDLVCIRSTVPIGATRALSQASGRADLAFAACPDRSIAGQAFVEQFAVPHIVGGLGEAAGAAAEAIFKGLGAVVRTPDPETAEAIKLFANAQRDVSFALANQFALICEATGIDFAAVRRAGAEGFARFAVARAGPVGGPCLSKDTRLLLDSGRAAGLDTSLLIAARRLNESLAGRVADAIDAELAILGKDARSVAILGLAFKGNPPTADRRGAFAEALIDKLQAARPGLEIKRWDPVCNAAAERRTALDGAALVVLANDHPALAVGLDADLPTGAVVFDMTGLLISSAWPDVRRLGDGRRTAR